MGVLPQARPGAAPASSAQTPADGTGSPQVVTTAAPNIGRLRHRRAARRAARVRDDDLRERRPDPALVRRPTQLTAPAIPAGRPNRRGLPGRHRPGCLRPDGHAGQRLRLHHGDAPTHCSDGTVPGRVRRQRRYRVRRQPPTQPTATWSYVHLRRADRSPSSAQHGGGAAPRCSRSRTPASSRRSTSTRPAPRSC